MSKESIFVAVGSVVMFAVFSWIAAGLLTVRDRYFPRKQRPTPLEPPYPAKWARRPWLLIPLRILLLPAVLFGLATALIVLLPVLVWNVIAALVSRLQRRNDPA